MNAQFVLWSFLKSIPGFRWSVSMIPSMLR